MRRLLWLLLLCSLAFGQSTVLTGSTVLTKTTKMGVSIPLLAPGFTWIQDTATGCTGLSTCTINTSITNNGGIYATSSGTGILFTMSADTNTTFSSITGGSGCTFTHAPSTSAFVTGHGIDMYYAIGCAAGAISFTITFSGTCGSSYCSVALNEILPPAGTTISYDTSNSTTAASGTTLPAVGLTLSSTDAVMEYCDASSVAVGANTWNLGWSSPFLTDAEAEAGVYLNAPAGPLTAPTVVIGSAAASACAAFAWKSTQPAFTTNAPVFAFVNYSAPNHTPGSLVTCSPACPATTMTANTSGNLVVVVNTNLGSAPFYISSISPAASWNCPASGEVAIGGTYSISYCTSTTLAAGTTSLTVTLTGSPSASNAGNAVFEFSRTTGTWTAEANSPQSVTNNTGLIRTGAPITLSGTNDLVIACGLLPGGPFAPTLFPQPGAATTNTMATYNQGECNVLLNSINGAAESWQFPGFPSAAAGFLKLAWQ